MTVIDTLVAFWRATIQHARNASCQSICVALFGVVTLICGMGGQLISLNMWFTKFPPPGSHVGGPFTVLTVVGTLVAIIFTLANIVWIAVKRPNLRVMLQPKAILFLLLIGMCNAGNGILLVNATPKTPELLQALLLSSMMIWTFGFAKIFGVSGGRTYCNPLVCASLLLSAGGIVLGMAVSINGSMTKLQAEWSVIFALAQVPGALYNVVTAKFYALTVDAVDAPTDDAQFTDEPRRLQPTDPTSAKFMILSFAGIVQMLLFFICFPLDWADWFGAHQNHPEIAKEALTQGWKCVFNTRPGCEGNYVYFVLFAMFYGLQMLGCVVVNHYSAPLCSMVAQIASPLTAIVLLIVPSWNVQNTTYNVGETIGAVILIVSGTILYYVWEEGTAAQHSDKDPTTESLVNDNFDYGTHDDAL